ncbi:autoinducer binding domain-containing protein [Caulobacter sp. 73W]|uniref:Autoinducer binding domain-containing protein n=1 Tax=Caulobacter sp. 73W TaxID=3161137 RepID=A0AB39KV38_9CAUL
MSRVEEALAQIGVMTRAQSVNAAIGAFERAIEPFGARTYSTWVLANPERMDPRLGMVSNWADEWTEYYLAKQQYLVDPVVQRALTQPGGFTWADISRTTSQASTELFRDARQFGLADGFTQPVGTGGLLNAAVVNVSGPTIHWTDMDQGVMSFVASTFMQRLLHLREVRLQPAVKTLSPQERRILNHASMGQSDKVIALHLEISPETVRTHWKRIFAKLQADDRAQAVAVGIWSGQIAP